MFELLLQADKSLADGALAEAERTYWQIVDLDPSNGIALAGLARVALARGDTRMARDFADRAVELDPESVAGRQVLEVLGGRDNGDGGLLRIDPGDDRDDGGADDTTEFMPTSGVADSAADAAATPTPSTATPLRVRHEPHHAMPVGRRYFEPEASKARPPDEFARAEMAAAIEAVETLDDEVVDDVAGLDADTIDGTLDADAMAAEALPTRGETDSTAETLDAVDATEADASVAMRVAWMSDAIVVDAAERAEDADSEDIEPTEAELAEVAEAIAMRIALIRDAPPVEVEEVAADGAEAAQEAIDEFEAAEFLAGHQAAQESKAALAAAEAGRRRRYARADDEEASEDEAEAQALREALEIVFEGDDDDGRDGTEAVPVVEAPVSDATAIEASAVELPVIEVPTTATSGGEVSYEAGAGSAPAKKGLFRRIRGK